MKVWSSFWRLIRQVFFIVGYWIALPVILKASSGLSLASPDGIKTATTDYVHQQLEQYTREYVKGVGGQQLTIQLIQPEQWQSLPECSSEPAAQFSEVTSTGKLTVNIRCLSSSQKGSGWKQRLTARIDFQIPVYITTTNVKRGDALTGLKSVTRSAMQVGSNALSGTDSVGHYIAARPLKAGTVITRDAVKQPMVVQRGAAVNITASSEKVVITTPGITLEGGRVGDIVQVKKENGRMISCQVISASEVRPVSAMNKRTSSNRG